MMSALFLPDHGWLPHSCVKVWKAERLVPFLPYVSLIIEEMKSGNILTPKGDRYVSQSCHNYSNTLNMLADFQDAYGTIFLSDLSLDFADQFHNHLMKRGLSKNTIAAQLIRLKAVCARLHAVSLSSFTGKGIPVQTERSTAVYTSIEWLRKLDSTPLSGSLALVRDVYILHCFVGLRVGDLRKFLVDPHPYLRREGDKTFAVLKAAKTGNDVAFPLNPIAVGILEKYNYSFGKLFSTQYYNQAIKTVGKIAGMDSRFIRTRTVSGVREDAQLPMYQLLTSHTARRSFATNAFLAGVPILNIMMVTGHTTESSFMRYIRCSSLAAAIAIAGHPFFMLENLDVADV